MAPDESERRELLLTRYGQLSQKHSFNSQVLHRTFYLSLVFLGVLLGFLIPQDNTNTIRAALCFFATIVFLALGLWTKFYLDARESNNRRRDAIFKELEQYEYDFQREEAELKSFFAPNHGGGAWKDMALQVYYWVIVLVTLVGGLLYLVEI